MDTDYRHPVVMLAAREIADAPDKGGNFARYQNIIRDLLTTIQWYQSGEAFEARLEQIEAGYDAMLDEIAVVLRGLDEQVTDLQHEAAEGWAKAAGFTALYKSLQTMFVSVSETLGEAKAALASALDGNEELAERNAELNERLGATERELTAHKNRLAKVTSGMTEVLPRRRRWWSRR